MIAIATLFAAAWVTPLSLPPYATIPIFPTNSVRDRNPFSTGGDVIAANVPLDNDDFAGRVVMWRNGTRIALSAAPDESSSPARGTAQSPFLQLGAVSPSGLLYVEQGSPFSGAYSGVDYSVYRRSGYGEWVRVDPGTRGGADFSPHIDQAEGNAHDGPDLRVAEHHLGRSPDRRRRTVCR